MIESASSEDRPLGFASKAALSRAVFAIIVTFLFLMVLSPLVFPVIMGGIFAILLTPAQKKLVRFKFAPALAAAVVTVGVTVLFFLPSAFLGFQAAKVARAKVGKFSISDLFSPEKLEAFSQTAGFTRLQERLTEYIPIDWTQVSETAKEALETIGGRAAELLGSLLTQLPGFAMALVVTVLSLYFFLIDGGRMVSRIRKHSFFSPAHTDRLLGAVESFSKGVVFAQLASGAGQAIVFSVFCLFAGVGQVALVAILVFFMSFVPLIGSAPLTFGIAIVQLLSGHTGAGIALLVGAGLVSALDNVIRPWILKDAGELHPLLAFIAAFGGLQVLGPMGIFLGPIIAGLFIVTLRLTVFESERS